MQSIEALSFTETQKALFGLLAQNLFGGDFTPSHEVDWQAVYRESYVQTVELPAFCKSQRYPMPPELLAEIKKHLRRAMMRDAVIHGCHNRLHSLLTEHHIPYVILKGASSAYYYPQIYLRGMGDVDFYIPEAYIEETERLLLENGFEIQDIDSEHHTVLMKNGVKYELHRDIPGVPSGKVGERIRALRADLCEQGILTKTDSAVFIRPNPFHHGLILLLHTRQHLQNEGLGLRHLCDWAVFVHAFPSEEFTEMLRERLTSVGLWTFARILSLAAVVAVGLPEAPWMTEEEGDLDLAVELLHDFLDGGNFGVKDGDRSRVYESMLISDPEKPKRSRVGNGLASVNQWVRHRWSAADKCPLLLPLGWVYFLLRRCWLVMTGKKKPIELKKTLENSGKRQDLYQRLKLFHTQE